MKKQFFLAEHEGVRELRSSSRPYTHAAFGGFGGISFHNGRHNAPSGASVVAVKVLTKEEAAAFKKAEAAAKSPKFKRNRLIGLIIIAGNDQRWAARNMHALQLQMRGATFAECEEEGVVGLFGYRHAGDLAAWLVGYQEKQAAAYNRLFLHRRALAKLDAGEE